MDVDYTRYSPGMELGGRVGAVPMSACLVCGRTCRAHVGKASSRFVHAVRIYRKIGTARNALEILHQCRANARQLELLRAIDLYGLHGCTGASVHELARQLWRSDGEDDGRSPGGFVPSKMQVRATERHLAKLVSMGALEVMATERVPKYRRPPRAKGAAA